VFKIGNVHHFACLHLNSKRWRLNNKLNGKSNFELLAGLTHLLNTLGKLRASENTPLGVCLLASLGNVLVEMEVESSIREIILIMPVPSTLHSLQ